MAPSERLRILFVEDSELDAELEEWELLKGGLDFEAQRVEDAKRLETVLREWAPHLVISDYALPQLVGIDVLAIALNHLPDVPFIFCSGAMEAHIPIRSDDQAREAFTAIRGMRVGRRGLRSSFQGFAGLHRLKDERSPGHPTALA